MSGGAWTGPPLTIARAAHIRGMSAKRTTRGDNGTPGVHSKFDFRVREDGPGIEPPAERREAQDADPAAGTQPPEITLYDFRNNPVVVPTDQWSIEAETVFLRGQCAAFAVALSHELPDATIRSAVYGDNTLIHVWLAQDGGMIDAEQFMEPEEDFVGNLEAHWGAGLVIKEWMRDSLMEHLNRSNLTSPQRWDVAERFVGAWRREFVEH